ncbi:MAG: hypothetical protein EOP09_08740, partial [Proteobacteria bacterium]
VILTKQDQVSDDEMLIFRQLIPASLAQFPMVEFSGVTRAGLDRLVSQTLTFGFKLTERKSGEVLLTRWDHVRAVENALEHLDRALTAMSEDLFAADIRQSLIALGPLIGETPTDDILGRIFSEFCIGK